MTNELMLAKFQKALPHLLKWIEDTQEKHSEEASSINTLSEKYGFSRLPLYFSGSVLADAKCVIVDELPMAPFASWGLTELSGFENSNFDGITYKNMYFIKTNSAKNEQLHFHELIHVIQWASLGANDFSMAYGSELMSSGYRDNRLEVMARDLENSFTQGGEPFQAENRVAGELSKLSF